MFLSHWELPLMWDSKEILKRVGVRLYLSS